MKTFYWWILKILGSPNRYLLVYLSCEVTHCRCQLATIKQCAGLGGCFTLCSLCTQEDSRLSMGKEDVKWEQVHWNCPIQPSTMFIRATKMGWTLRMAQTVLILGYLALCLGAQGTAFAHKSVPDLSNQCKHLKNPLAGLILTLLRLFSEELGKRIGKWTRVTILQLQLDIRHHAMTNKTSLQGVHKWEVLTFLWQEIIVQLWVPSISFVSSRATGHLRHNNELQKSTSVSDDWVLVFFAPFTEIVST